MRFLLFILPFFVFFSFKKESNAPVVTEDVPYTVNKNTEDTKKPFEVFPNPVDHEFTLKSDYFENGDTQLFIFDVSGKVVLKYEQVLFDEENSVTLNVSHFSEGMYLIQLRSGNYSVTKKIVKI